MKKIVLALVLCVAVAGVSAQEKKDEKRPDAKELAQKKTDKLKERLSLSDEQAQKVNDIFLKKAQQLEKMRADEEKKMKKVLNDAQFEEWKKMRDEGCKAREHQGKGHRGEGRGEVRIDHDRRGDMRPVEKRPGTQKDLNFEKRPPRRLEGEKIELKTEE